MTLIRKATENDLASVVSIYGKILRREDGEPRTGWKSGVYPTEETALTALKRGDLYVMEAEGAVVASARINQEQEPAYKQCRWSFPAPDDRVMVIHTLTVDPDQSGRGYATEFVAFYESHARERGCLALRMDTNAINLNARRLYKKLGYRESAIIPCNFQGLGEVRLVCMEKSLAQAVREE